MIMVDVANLRGWEVEQYGEYPIFEFLQLAMSAPAKDLTRSHWPVPSLLHEKMKHLEGHPIYMICMELRSRNDGHGLESHDEISLLSYLKKRFAESRKFEKARANKRPSASERITAVRRRNRYG